MLIPTRDILKLSEFFAKLPATLILFCTGITVYTTLKDTEYCRKPRILIRVIWALELTPAAIGRKAGYSLVRAPVYSISGLTYIAFFHCMVASQLHSTPLAFSSRNVIAMTHETAIMFSLTWHTHEKWRILMDAILYS